MDAIQRVRLGWPHMTESYRVELVGPHPPHDGGCQMCPVQLGRDGVPLISRRYVFDLSLVRGNVSDTWRLCRDHIKEVRAVLRGTIK